MPLFVCDECHVIENTALGHYWSRKHVKFLDSSKNGLALCSACAPALYVDKKPTGLGVWHNKFEREMYCEEKHKNLGLINL
jgi:hypothetical protein